MSLPKYILNLDEFAKLIGNMEITPGMSGADLSRLEQLLEDNLAAIRELLLRLLGERMFHCADMSKHIPAIDSLFVIRKVFDRDILITGIAFSQSGWKAEDTISLNVGDTVLIDAIHTKELGQDKRFSAAWPVSAGEEVKVLYDNRSGNSKMFFCDLDYIEASPRQGDEKR